MPAFSFLSSGVLIVLSAFLFSCAHPGCFFVQGIPLCAWFYFIPFLVLIQSVSYKKALLCGAFYGALAYGLFAYWLYSYSVYALIAVCVCYGLFFAIVALLLCFTSRAFPQQCWLLHAGILLAFEFLRSQTEFGFYYGIIGYSQWKIPLFIHTAYIGGVWGISACIYLFASLCAAMVRYKSFYRYRFSALSLFCCIALYIGIGNLVQPAGKKNQEEKKLTVALIQNNPDPNKDGINEYRKEVESLLALTDQALAARPDIQLVVWPETAVVPDILKHYYSLADYERHTLVVSLLSYLDEKPCAFLIGNNHAEMTTAGAEERFNSALYFEPKKTVLPPQPQIYNKVHLVPFSEFLPHNAAFLSSLFKSAYFKKPGNAVKLFSCADSVCATPICFEDTFPAFVHSMKKQGANLIVNLSNDSWANSIACQYQHLAMAAFRSAENGIPTVRSTASGQTAVIDWRGTVISCAPAYEACFICADVTIR